VRLVFFILLVGAVAQAVPTFSDVKKKYEISESLLLDRNGEVLQRLRVNLLSRQFEWVPLAEVSPSLKDAVLYLEDRRFFSHDGVDKRALLRAAWDQRPWFRGKKRGASTITMQLAGLLDPERLGKVGRRNGWQKWSQIGDARSLEKTWSKDEILEAYLNLVSFHGDKKGLRTVSQLMLGKDPHGLTESESMILASRIQSPSQKIFREERVCALFKKWKGIEDCEPVRVSLASTWGRTSAPSSSPSLAYHLMMRLKSSTAKSIATSLDIGLQAQAIETLRDQLSALKNKNVNDGAVIVLENDTGLVRAYVGNQGEGSSAKYVDAITALRQAGSTLKPFVYATAFEKQILRPETLIDDSPSEISIEGGRGVYRPQNYDNRFRGWVSAREALASSLNVPALKVFLQVGGEEVIGRMDRLGFKDLRSAEDYGPSLALGTADISLWELTNAYRALANGGKYSEATFFPGELNEATEVFSNGAVSEVAQILSDRSARSLTFGLENVLSTRSWTAVKTGTSKDMRDNWCIGFGKRFTVGVWVGNLSGEPMWNVSGVSGAAPVWAALMDRLESGGNPSPTLAKASVPLAPLTTRRIARILYPTDGMIVALDPDIPRARQKIFFEQEAVDPGDFLEIKSRSGETERLKNEGWTPRHGVYDVLLKGKDGRAKDRVAFEVRGRLTRKN